MTYAVKDMVFQYGRYYFLLDHNEAYSLSDTNNLEVWMDGRLIDEDWQFKICKDFLKDVDKVLVLACKDIPISLKKWKKGKQCILLKAKEVSKQRAIHEQKRYDTKLEKHKQKWWIFTWYDY